MPLQADENGKLTVISKNQREPIRSEAMNEIMSRHIGHLSRWSLLFFISLLILLFVTLWSLHFPDIITARARLSGVNIPYEIIAHQEGKLVRLFVKSGDSIRKNQVLGWLESNADPAQVIALSLRIDSALSFLAGNKNRQLAGLFDKHFNDLGELQNSYLQFITTYPKLVMRMNPITLKKRANNNIQARGIQHMIFFQEALQNLKSTFDDWKRKYLLSSPFDGKVVFTEPLQQNRSLRTGQSIGFINPGKSQFFMEVDLPQLNFGKVSVGQHVQLRFDAYPYNEFGFVKGKLSFISEIATDSGFVAQVSLPDGLRTTEHREIQFKNGLSAEALVITKDINLLQRLFYGIVKGTNQQ